MNTDSRGKGAFALAHPDLQTVRFRGNVTWRDSFCFICVHLGSSVVSMEWTPISTEWLRRRRSWAIMRHHE